MPIMIIITPYMFIAWPLWPTCMLWHWRSDNLARGHLRPIEPVYWDWESPVIMSPACKLPIRIIQPITLGLVVGQCAWLCWFLHKWHPVLNTGVHVNVLLYIFDSCWAPFCGFSMFTPTTLLVVNAFTTNTSWTRPVRFESLMLVLCMETVNCLLIAALLDRC